MEANMPSQYNLKVLEKTSNDIEVEGLPSAEMAGDQQDLTGVSPTPEHDGSARVELPLESLRRGFSARFGSEDVKHAQALAETFDKLPPIVVHRATMNVLDGNHRVLAARMLRRTSIGAVYFEGNEDDAYVEAVRRNIAHGRPLTVRERERAAVRMLAAHPEWSDRRISEVCGLSPKTVARHRPDATVENPQLRTRVGRDGKRRPTDPALARLHIAAVVRERPDAPLSEIAARTGSSEATVRDVRQRLRDGQSPVPEPESRARNGRPPASSCCDREQIAPWSDDTALRSTPAGNEFAQWFDRSTIEPGHWGPHVDSLPLSRLPLIANEARRRASCWNEFCEALGNRIRNSPRR